MAGQERKGLAAGIDPRAKIVALVVVCVGAIFCRDVLWGSALFVCVLAFAVAAGRILMAAKFLAGYLVVLGFVALITWLCPGISGGVGIVFQSLRASFPTFVLAALLVSTTKTGDLVAALYSLRMPRMLVIPLAVGIRFFPTLAEEFRYIVDAARLQGLRPSLAGVVRHTAAICESLIVPTVLRSAKIAEELAAAAVVRGIEKPGARTSFNELALSKADAVLLAAFCAACAAVVAARFAVKGGGL